MVSKFEHAFPHLLLSLATAEANPVFGASLQSGKTLANILIVFPKIDSKEERK